jgi:hypothetical protein
MGQYYKPVCLSDNKKNVIGFIYSHDIKSRYKREDGQTFIVGEGLKLMEHSYINNKMMRCVENLLTPGGEWFKKPIVWAGDYAEPEEHTGENFYGMAYGTQRDGEGVSIQMKPKPISLVNSKKHRFIINHTTKEFVDKECVKKDNNGYRIHPLSLLTSEGNGMGNGDFRGGNKYVGTWARHIISVETTVPAGYNEIKPNFYE